MLLHIFQFETKLVMKFEKLVYPLEFSILFNVSFCVLIPPNFLRTVKIIMNEGTPAPSVFKNRLLVNIHLVAGAVLVRINKNTKQSGLRC